MTDSRSCNDYWDTGCQIGAIEADTTKPSRNDRIFLIHLAYYSCIINPNCPITPSDETVVSYAPMECVRRGYLESKEIVYGDIPTGLTYFADGDIIMAKVTPCFENGNIGIAENLRAGSEEKETRRESLQRERERRKVCLEGWIAGIRRAF